jgi:putative spermidine/putrescine transport system ATP-binding protein
MSEMKGFSIQDLTKEFGGKTALSRFSLEISHGEFVTFLGPSGCGKSTALNCIAGLLPLTQGKVFVDGECIDDSRKTIPAEKRGFGMVFQNYALFPHLTVFQNVAFGLKLRKLSAADIKVKVAEALKMVHLEGHESKFPTQMSGGEQQRVAIARCIVLEPKLLMLDEPLSNLDAKLRVEMRNEILSLHTRLRVTTIYVTHDQAEALALSDRIVVLKSGVVQQIGTPEEVYSNPANLFVADFMGFKNLWDAEITSLKEKENGLEAAVSVNRIPLTARLAYSKGDPRRDALMNAFKGTKKVKTAIRPEDINVGRQEGAIALKAKVQLVEYQGQSSYVSAQIGEGTDIEFRSTSAVHMGETLDLSIRPERVFLFAENGGAS